MTADRPTPRRRFGRLIVFAVLLAAIAACSGDDDTATSTTVSSSVTTTPTSISLPPVAVAPLPAQGEPPVDGSHAAFLRVLDIDAGTVTIDIVRWLEGDAADEAYAAETGDDSGAPNDYFIVNETEATRTLALDAPAVTVAWDSKGPGQRRIDLQELPGYLADRQDPEATFWVTVAGGAVVRIDEQYRP